jgi:hypothetical protein
MVAVLACCCRPAAQADTVQLKDNTAVVGKILAEKPEQVAVDIGFTVVLVPRDQIVAIVKTEVSPSPVPPLAGPGAAAAAGDPLKVRAKGKGVQVHAPRGATLTIRDETESKIVPLELTLPAGIYTVTFAGEGPRDTSGTVRLEPGGTNGLGAALQKPQSDWAAGEPSLSELIRLCLTESERIDWAGESGRFFTPAAARGEKAEWEAWKRVHRIDFDRSPELRKAWLGVIRAINLNTPGAM